MLDREATASGAIRAGIQASISRSVGRAFHVKRVLEEVLSCMPGVALEGFGSTAGRFDSSGRHPARGVRNRGRPSFSKGAPRCTEIASTAAGGGAFLLISKAATDDLVLGRGRGHFADRDRVLGAALSHIRHQYRPVIRVLLTREGSTCSGMMGRSTDRISSVCV
jgi:hypothetical protein